MYLTLPERVPMGAALSFAGLLAVAQIVEGTSPIIALMGFVFVLAAALAFNVSGGAVYPSGAYIASCAFLSAILGMVAKVLLGEPFQRNLLVPEKSMEIYTVGMLSMLAASYVNRVVRPKRAVLDRFTMGGSASGIGLVCMIIAVGGPIILPKEVVATFNQANGFLILAVMIPVFDTVRRSGGRRSFNGVALFAYTFLTITGILSFSKERMFGASAAWAIAAIGAGYRASARKLVILGVIGTFSLLILTPYSQVARNFGLGLDVSLAAPLAIQLLSHPLDLRDTYNSQANAQLEDDSNYHFFDKSEGILDRLNMVAVDDALIRITDRGLTAEPGNLWTYFINIIPRYLYPDKPIWHWGNVYAHSLDMLAPDDDTTGISFSPFGDGYHCAQWLGVTVYSFGIFLFGFFMMDTVAGSVNRSFWPLLYVLYMLHQAAEGMLGAPVYGGGTYSIFVIVLAYVCTRIIPVIVNLTKRSDKSASASFAPAGQNVQSA